MTQGKIQLASQASRSLDRRVITVSRPQRSTQEADGDEPLFFNVIRRRWMLLTTCLLLSAVAAGIAATQFTLPKAITTGKLRYVELPPALKDVYQAPSTLELAEILRSNESMAELARRAGVQMDSRTLAKRFKIQASRFSNIIDLELRWRDGQQAITMVNELMQIARDTTTENRKRMLQQYAIETDVQLEEANQRVMAAREKVLKLQQQHTAKLTNSGKLGPELSLLMSQIDRTEQLLDELTVKRITLNDQLTTLKSDVRKLQQRVRAELLNGRRQQAKTRMKIYTPNTQKYNLLSQVLNELDDFEQSARDLDYLTWRTKLEAIGIKLLGKLDPSSVAAVQQMERSLEFKRSKIEQIEFELLPIDGHFRLLENRRESQERRLADLQGTADISTAALEEAEAQLESAIDARSRLQLQIGNIRRGEETKFHEMTVLTPASWQTTEASEGRGKLFAFTFAGCFVVLVLPVFALEHFCPSGHPADQAAKSLGIPRLSQGTFVSYRDKSDRRKLHSVNSESIRLLALRIQQSVSGSGAIVLFSGLNHGKSPIPMLSYLAECLARREEKVLIVDACERPGINSNPIRAKHHDGVRSQNGSNRSNASVAAESSANGGASTLPADVDATPGIVGLSDFLERPEIGIDEMICPTSIPGVDMISSGRRAFPCEGLAASCLTGLFEECRQRYTMILVAGPATDQPSDLQMMSARADAIFFTIPADGRAGGTGEEVVRDLLDLGAPVAGIVS